MNITDTDIYKENDKNIKLYQAILFRLLQAKKLMDSGKYKFECDKSYDGYHEWRTKRFNPDNRILEKTLPYCWYCGEIDETDTKTPTPIPGDKNWQNRNPKLIPK